MDLKEKYKDVQVRRLSFLFMCLILNTVIHYEE